MVVIVILIQDFSSINTGEEMNKVIVLTTGVFHTVHPGHIELFEYCSKIGSLVVGINTDNYVIQKSGKVLIPLVDRIYMLKSIRYIDHVVTFGESNACELLRKINPHYFVKGPDYLNVPIPEQDTCSRLHIKYLVAPQAKKYSTTELLDLSKR